LAGKDLESAPSLFVGILRHELDVKLHTSAIITLAESLGQASVSRGFCFSRRSVFGFVAAIFDA